MSSWYHGPWKKSESYLSREIDHDSFIEISLLLTILSRRDCSQHYSWYEMLDIFMCKTTPRVTAHVRCTP